jgi:hypothetical protein
MSVGKYAIDKAMLARLTLHAKQLDECVRMLNQGVSDTYLKPLSREAVREVAMNASLMAADVQENSLNLYHDAIEPEDEGDDDEPVGKPED